MASVVTGVAMIAAADVTVARDRGRDLVEPPAQTLNRRAAIAVVSIKDQRISLYDADGGAVRAPISSGQTGYETPVGVFSILQKKEEHYSNLYDDASMPFMQRITWSGVALHAGALPGHPASHGCIRLPHGFAQRIFPLTKLGMRVVISRDDIAPVEIADPLLPKPQPIREAAVVTSTAYRPTEQNDAHATILDPDVRNWRSRQTLLDSLKAEAKVKADEVKAVMSSLEALKADLKTHGGELALVAKRDRAAQAKRKAEARLANADKRYAEAKTPRAQQRAEKERAAAAAALVTANAALAEATKAAEEADKVVGRFNDEIAAIEAAKTAAVAAAAEARRKTMPVSIFVSAASQKLYVRQGNEPVFETQVAVANPDHPIGTHVFTALDYANNGNDVRWNVVSISRRSAGTSFGDDISDDYRRSRKRAEKSGYAPPVTSAAAAAAALARISIPADVRARISEHVWPGSSLIISDEELSKETGKATDFIVVVGDEPHGALAKRKRVPPPSNYRDYFDDDYYFSYRPSNRPYYRYERRRAPSYKGPFGWW